MHCTRKASGLSLTVSLIMQEEGSLDLPMCWKKDGIRPIKTGSTSVLKETATTTTDSGTRAGKATTTW